MTPSRFNRNKGEILRFFNERNWKIREYPERNMQIKGSFLEINGYTSEKGVARPG